MTMDWTGAVDPADAPMTLADCKTNDCGWINVFLKGPLAQGRSFLIDARDWRHVRQLAETWFLLPGLAVQTPFRPASRRDRAPTYEDVLGETWWYTWRRPNVVLQRAIMRAISTETVHFLSDDRLDFRRSNLRVMRYGRGVR